MRLSILLNISLVIISFGTINVSGGLTQTKNEDKDISKPHEQVAYSLERTIEESLNNVKQEFDKFIDSLSLAYRQPKEEAADDSDDADGEADADSRRHHDKLEGHHRGHHQDELEDNQGIPAVEGAPGGDAEDVHKASNESAENHPKGVDENEVNKSAAVNVSKETKFIDADNAELGNKDCDVCNVPKEKAVDYRIEKFKAQLLEKLGLTEPPQVDGPIHPLPNDFYIGEKFAVNDEPDEDEKDDNLNKPKTREIFVFGADVTDSCLNKKGAGCYSFNITDKGIYPEEVGSVELWIYKQADLNDHHIQTFVVSELSKKVKKGREYLQSRNIVQRIETRLKKGWMKIYVNRMVQRWLSKPQRNNGLAVVCKTCKWRSHKTLFGEKEGMMPFLVFYMNRRTSRFRIKRETRCLEGGGNCCRREPLEINFSDIGWDYIMAPPSIRPNYCTGSCNGIHAAYYNHTRLVQMLQQSVTHEFTPIQPCCSPVHFRRTQSLLYRDHRGDIRKIDIPDLIVGECGCT